MKKSAQIMCCPHCGGTSGFEFYAKVRMAGTWGRDDSESSGGGIYTRGVTCIDCGHRVNRRRAEGW